jgi:hypothetical protein
MGKNISVYLNDELLGLIEASGKPADKVIQEALKKYFHPENRITAVEEAIEAALKIGESDKLKEAIAELNRDREWDRW